MFDGDAERRVYVFVGYLCLFDVLFVFYLVRCAWVYLGYGAQFVFFLWLVVVGTQRWVVWVFFGWYCCG